MSKVTGGELVVMTLADHGVRNVFSIIGGQMCSIYDSLSHHPEMKLVTVRNEAAAPMMAAGCAAVTGVPSVSMCTVGAGVVYEVAGLMAAWYSYLPVISIAPQVQSWKMKPHQENLQGCNQDEIFAPITKWNAIAYHWDRIPAMVHRALREAQANAPGPTHLDIPVDVLFQLKKFDGNKKSKIMPPAANTRFIGALPGPVEQVKRAGETMAASRRPLVVIGQSMGRPGRYPGLKGQLNGLNLPALLGDCSSGIMDGRDASYAGALGLFTGSPRGLGLIREADLLLIIGLDPEIQDLLRALGKDLPPVVQVEVDPSALLNNRREHFGVNADPISFLAAANQAGDLPGGPWTAWLDRVQQTGADLSREFSERAPRTAALFQSVSAGLNREDILVVDGAETVGTAYALLRKALYRNLFLMNTRDMAGTGLPFAIGAKIGMPQHRVTLLTDKDSLCRHLQELQTATGLGLDLDLVCVDPGEGQALTRTEAILEGLGCEISHLGNGQSLARSTSGRPRAWLCTE
jgi:acetolactate synthase-1/2/3 large subunit